MASAACCAAAGAAMLRAVFPLSGDFSLGVVASPDPSTFNKRSSCCRERSRKPERKRCRATSRENENNTERRE